MSEPNRTYISQNIKYFHNLECLSNCFSESSIPDHRINFSLRYSFLIYFSDVLHFLNFIDQEFAACISYAWLLTFSTHNLRFLCTAKCCLYTKIYSFQLVFLLLMDHCSSQSFGGRLHFEFSPSFVQIDS